LKRIGTLGILAGMLWLFAAGNAEGQSLKSHNTLAVNEDARLSARKQPGSATAKLIADNSPTTSSAQLHKRHSLRRAYDRGTSPRQSTATREMSFEVLRMLSTGMSKAEVLSRAGPPSYTFRNGGMQKWMYRASDGWHVEINFAGNNVAAIEWTRARP